MCLRYQGIDDNNGGVVRVRQARGISDDDRGVGRGRGIHNTSEVSEKTTEAAGDRQWYQGIYDDDGGISGGR